MPVEKIMSARLHHIKQASKGRNRYDIVESASVMTV